MENEAKGEVSARSRAEMAMGVRMARYRDNVCFRYFGVDFSEPLDEFPSEELLAQLELLRLANT